MKPRRESHDIELIASLRKKAESIEKAREAFVWQRMKEHSKELKSRKSYEINLQSILGGKSSFRKTDAKFKSRLAFGINIETP